MEITAENFSFRFGAYGTSVHITPVLPGIDEIAGAFGGEYFRPLIVCDENTEALAVKIAGVQKAPLCILKAGEANKGWPAAEAILQKAYEAGLNRDGTLIGVGGGLVCDLCAFAASIYMRGCSLALVPSSLLCMADACIGGKTGFDLFGIKNLAGTFYPASHVFLSAQSLASLPLPEWKSGMAEIIKTAVLDSEDFLDELEAVTTMFPKGSFAKGFPPDFAPVMLGRGIDLLSRCVGRAVQFKGGIVEEDPLETGSRRILLNLGHSFGHALESSAGLGKITHGEAVAWGIARSCDLGISLGICPRRRAEKITELLSAFGYETSAPHPLMENSAAFIQALGGDKKKREGKFTFIVPDKNSARPVTADASSLLDTVNRIIIGELPF